MPRLDRPRGSMHACTISVRGRVLAGISKNEKGSGKGNGEAERACRAVNESHKEDSDWSLRRQEYRSGNDIATNR